MTFEQLITVIKRANVQPYQSVSISFKGRRSVECDACGETGVQEFNETFDLTDAHVVVRGCECVIVLT